MKKLISCLLILTLLVTLLTSCTLGGKDGVDGKDGINGLDGIDGVDGKDGKDGENGKDGKDGKDGSPGEKGANGTDGKSAFELFKAEHPTYQGTEEQWLETYFGTTAEEVYAKVKASVVTLEAYNYSGVLIATGSGFFINNSGLIMTAYHVIDGAETMKVRLSNGNSDHNITMLIQYDEARDLALLQSDCTNTVPLESNAQLTNLKPGERVYSFGSSLGYLYSSLGEGILSATPRYKSIGNNEYCTIIQYTAPVSQGNSGGPILDKDGKVIGIVTFGDTRGEALCFATHVSEVAKMSTTSGVSLSTHKYNTTYYKEKLGHIVLDASDLDKDINNAIWLSDKNGRTILDTAKQGEKDYYQLFVSDSGECWVTIGLLFENGMTVTVPKMYEGRTTDTELDVDWQYLVMSDAIVVYAFFSAPAGEYLIEVDGAYPNMSNQYAIYTYWTNNTVYERYRAITELTDFIPGI